MHTHPYVYAYRHISHAWSQAQCCWSTSTSISMMKHSCSRLWSTSEIASDKNWINLEISVRDASHHSSIRLHVNKLYCTHEHRYTNLSMNVYLIPLIEQQMKILSNPKLEKILSLFKCGTLISIMIVFFFAQKKTILIPNAEYKDQSGALFWNLNLNFFFQEKKRQSLWKSE